jgi:hypothetical protein
MSAPPCHHLESEPARCALGRRVPEDCGSRCSGYLASTRMPLDDAERTRCEIWTRVMGYHRPVSAFNAGKLSEHRERRTFAEYSLREGGGHD